jgi:positive regulator of sigma E activity
VERAQTWNVREELNQEKKSTERYTDLIQMELASALEASENIDANLKLTSIIRMLGLNLFFLILLTASYLIHKELFIIISIVTIYGIVASVIMFGFRKRMYKLLLMKNSYKESYQFKIVTK